MTVKEHVQIVELDSSDSECETANSNKGSHGYNKSRFGPVKNSRTSHNSANANRRNLRKIEARMRYEQLKLRLSHDENGLINGVDLCDCLVLSCPGCCFPCWECRSPKCGASCRNGRKQLVECIEHEASGLVLWNPLLKKRFNSY